MSFANILNSHHPDFTSMPRHCAESIINTLSRKDIIGWLSWNDPNGIYNDVQSLKELGNIMTEQEGREIMLRQIDENRFI